MALDHPESSRTTALLAPLADEGLPAPQTAQAVITAWHAIDDALTPVVGARGLVALYLRAVHLTAADPMLAVGDADRQALIAAITPALLQALITGQSPAQAAAIGNTFLQIFYSLLSSLVGPSLAARLLHVAWGPSVSTLPVYHPLQ